MTTITLNDINKEVSFDVYAPAILGSNFNRLTLTAFLDYETAKQYMDVRALAVQVYPSLPTGSPNDFTKYQYLKLKRGDGTVVVIAMNWVKPDTYQIVKTSKVTIQVTVNSNDDVERIRKLLISNNYVIENLAIN